MTASVEQIYMQFKVFSFVTVRNEQRFCGAIFLVGRKVELLFFLLTLTDACKYGFEPCTIGSGIQCTLPNPYTTLTDKNDQFSSEFILQCAERVGRRRFAVVVAVLLDQLFDDGAL